MKDTNTKTANKENNNDILLEVKNLSIAFGGLKAVDDLNLNIKRGQLYGLIGPNGAGKTTVFNMLNNKQKYTVAEGILRLPRFFKEEKKMNEKAMELLRVFELDEDINTLASNLPYGKQRKLEIARALATEPKLLLLDEPAAGMNPNETAELMETIQFVRKEYGVTILLIEHDMKLVSGICEEIMVPNFGTELAHGKPEVVLNKPEVVTAYLGE